MHRDYLLELLNNYFPANAVEQKFKAEIIDFVTNNSDCFERFLEDGHITASAWVVNKNNTHVLLMHHAKLDNWFQLGGHCDGNPNVLEVAIKEAQEESGIQAIIPISNNIFDIDIHLIPETTKTKAHYHYDIRFLLQVISNENVVQNEESKELRWVEKNIIHLPTQNNSIIRMFTKWIYR